MKLGTNNIDVSSVSVVSEHPFVWLFQSIMLIINRNMDRTAFCTILESFGGKGCGHGMCLTGMPTS